METYLDPTHFDLITPDATITQLTRVDERTAEAMLFIEGISPTFVGFQIEPELVQFNIKSTLAQIGVDAICQNFQLDKKTGCAEVKVVIHAIGFLAREMLKLIQVGASIGKLFAADRRRRVRNPDYLARMFGRSDRRGKPLLSLGGLHGSSDLILDKVEGRTVAYLALQHGRLVYDETMLGFLPTLAKGLMAGVAMRDLLRLHQEWKPHLARNVEDDEILLVRTLPLHIRTVFGRVVDNLLSEGYRHTSASVLQPDTQHSGDVYELYGSSKRELTDIPLEFYTLEPYREHVFFADRDQLQSCLEDDAVLFKAFETAPQPLDLRAAVFIVKGDQLQNLKPEEWITRETRYHEFPGPLHGTRQAMMLERFIEQQPSYPFLKSIDLGAITSQGVLLTRHFPSPLMKRLLLGDQIQTCLKGIYFQRPSSSSADFFSHEDRALLHDLYKFAIPVYWVDSHTKHILKYVERPYRDTGMFVPKESVDTFLRSTVFGIYGSNLLEGVFEQELRKMLAGILEMRDKVSHSLLNADTPIALVTGGGPGAMEVGNRVARELNILSCANIVDFRIADEPVVNEQRANPYVEAKMTYRLDRLVERQAEFYLDLPIFLTGGIGTDFEYSLEEVRRKVGATAATPIMLFGDPDYWRAKITSRFKSNLAAGTIKGSEWLSNCFYCIQHAEQGLRIYFDYFSNKLPIGHRGPCYPNGFVEVDVDY
ncbi:MAG: LOG family protein [Chlamydiales bacterium]|nr:LOG family protein [Chlamydiales bacterium]